MSRFAANFARPLGAFLGAFACAVIASSGAGCSGSSDCECPDIPDRPEPQGPLTVASVSTYDDEGNDAELPIAPENGTLDIAGDTVVIVYEEDGVEHTVTYDVVGPL